MIAEERFATAASAPEAAELTENAVVAEDPAEAAVAPKRRRKPVVVLVGPPGAGKSTIGRRLSSALHTELVDSDALIEESEGKNCGEVFSTLGEPAFRELEAEQVAKALESRGVVSLGGGAVLTDSTREKLKNHTVVWVDVSPEEGAKRTAAEATRPVLAAADPVEHYRQLVEKRKPLYKEVSKFRARTDNKSPQKVVADILGFLETGV